MRYMPHGPKGQYLQEMLTALFMYDLTSRFLWISEEVLRPYAEGLACSIATIDLERGLYEVYSKLEKLNETGHIYGGRGDQT